MWIKTKSGLKNTNNMREIIQSKNYIYYEYGAEDCSVSEFITDENSNYCFHQIELAIRNGLSDIDISEREL